MRSALDRRLFVTAALFVFGCAAAGAGGTNDAGGAPAGTDAGGRGAVGGAIDAGTGGAVDAGIDEPRAPTDSASAGAGHDAAREPGDADGGPRGCATFALCDDFEGAAVGGKPDPTKWTVGAPNVTGTGALAIDDGQHHSGARSVKVSGQGGYSNHIFLTNAAAIANLGPSVWARFWLRLSDPLGEGHTAFLALTDAADGGKHVRMGGQSKILMWNRESDDATLPALSPTGIAASRALPANQWLCIEFNVDGTATPAAMRTWVDGVEVPGLHVDATPTPDLDEQWLRKPSWRPTLTDFSLGWESYAGQAMTLWFDDVALDRARIGCP